MPSINILPPPATCKNCGTKVKLEQWNTFSYWYCSKCKDEVDVWLNTARYSVAERSQYEASEPNDIILSGAGVWFVEYENGEHGWYERGHLAGGHVPPRDTILDGSKVRRATRLTKSHLPDRKQLSSLACNTGKETQKRGHGPGDVSVPRYCPDGDRETNKNYNNTFPDSVYLAGELYPKYIYTETDDLYWRINVDGSVVSATKEEVWEGIRSGTIGAQQWKVFDKE